MVGDRTFVSRKSNERGKHCSDSYEGTKGWPCYREHNMLKRWCNMPVHLTPWILVVGRDIDEGLRDDVVGLAAWSSRVFPIGGDVNGDRGRDCDEGTHRCDEWVANMTGAALRRYLYARDYHRLPDLSPPICSLHSGAIGMDSRRPWQRVFKLPCCQFRVAAPLITKSDVNKRHRFRYHGQALSRYWQNMSWGEIIKGNTIRRVVLSGVKVRFSPVFSTLRENQEPGEHVGPGISAVRMPAAISKLGDETKLT